ncbi:hypothetical protein Q7C36_016865 [Tachysurus vachellii]|uniref:Angiomotin C-terminal domain-containing protein n=1 Tax=Tachysurus vachellii TaxID=175792 RepID=A0AA88SHC6_TACVA|nr:hypothetical protein Q7C36_016865 [Tachysurus vachellii]
MRTEEASSTVLHRLIQEQLRYGNPTDARTLLAIQQQALRSTVSRGAGSPRSSSDSLTQEERQEPQGQEHHLDFQHTEIYPPYHHEQLPTYEQAKANSQLVASQWCQDRRIYPEDDLKPSHGRSLSERLMQLSLLHKDVNVESLSMSSSCSYPQIAGYQFRQHHLGFRSHTHTSDQTHESDAFYQKPPPPFHSQHTRIVPPEAPHVFCSAPPAGREVSPQMDLLMKENERLKQELKAMQKRHSGFRRMLASTKRHKYRISPGCDVCVCVCVCVNKTKENVPINYEMRIKNIRSDRYTAIITREEQKLQCARMEREVQLLREERSAAQERSRQLQAELNRKSAYVERVERLQGALAQLQATCEKREGLEHRLRTRLESELRTLRNRQRQTQTCPGISAPSANVSTLLERLREREERILALEADMTRWEQKYLEEKTMMEFAMDTAATAAAQRDTNIINNRSPCLSSTTSCSEELPRAEIQSQEMENRIQALYGQIREKDAMINVLQYRLQQEQEKGEADEDASSNCASHSDSSSSNDKGKCNTEKTGIMARFSPFADAVCKTRGRAQTTTHTPPASEQLSSSQEISKQKAANPFEGLDSVEAEAVEIFI